MDTAHWINFWVVNSFTKALFRGNPVGVVLDSAGLSDSDMRSIARAVGTPETVFVFPASEKKADLHLRCFTGTCELPFSGPATIAALHTLAETSHYTPPTTLTIKTPSGSFNGALTQIEGQTHPMVEIPLPRFEPSPITLQELAGALLVSAETLHPTWAPRKQNLSLIVAFRQTDTLLNLYPDFRRLSRLGLEHDITNFCCFSKTDESGVDWILRLFSPGLGINEEPVSGAAHGSVAAYLIEQGVLTCSESTEQVWLGEQGDYMECRGQVRTICKSDSAGQLSQIRVGGFALTAIQGQVRIS